MCGFIDNGKKEEGRRKKEEGRRKKEEVSSYLLGATNAQCPMPHAQCPMPNALCPMPNAQFAITNYQLKMPESHELETIEIQLLLEGMFRYYGFDFRNYALASLKRRIWNTIRSERLTTVSALQEKVLHNPAYLDRLLLDISVNVTAMFRDPSFYISFRNKVVPLLRTYPFIRIWHAGCSTGEEVYSMAILLQEEGLYDRCRIYATDMNELVLKTAKMGIFPLKQMQEYTQLYHQAGGKKAFSEYYTAAYENAIFRSSLKDHIVFAHHNLATDTSFNEFNVILCRNVMIYFNSHLQERVHKLFYESLGMFGVLGLGHQESLIFTPYEKHYEAIESSDKLYRRVK